jgi:hypothetical protein
MHLTIYTVPMCPIRWCQTMAGLFLYWSSRFLLTFFGFKKKEPKCYCLSNSPVNEPTSRFPNRAPIERLAIYRAFFYISLGLLNKQGQLIKQNFTFISQSRERSAPSMFRQRSPMETAAPFPQPIYYSFIHSHWTALWWLQYLTGQDIWRYVRYVYWHRIRWYMGK